MKVLFLLGCALLLSTFCLADHSMPLHYVQRQDDPTPPMVYFSKNFELGYTVYRSEAPGKTIDVYLYLYDLKSDVHYQGTVFFKIQSPNGEIQKLVKTYTDDRFLYILQLKLLPEQIYNLKASIEDDKSISFEVPLEALPAVQRVSTNSSLKFFSLIAILPLTLFIAAVRSRRRINLSENLS